jgi:hypothetical protein
MSLKPYCGPPAPPLVSLPFLQAYLLHSDSQGIHLLF